MDALRVLASRHGMLIGAAVNMNALGDDLAYRETLAREFSSLTAENAIKWKPLQPERGTFDFAEADALVDFAKANDAAMRGHVLVWHEALPEWVTEGRLTRREWRNVLQEHIQTVASHFRGRVAVWDVVNEALDGTGAFRESLWLERLGPDYLDDAFRWAHEADPDARLFYNDYDAEGGSDKAMASRALLSDLLSRGVPVHGVGLQMHLHVDAPPKPDDVAETMARLADLGLEVHVTELDVAIEGAVTAEKLDAQADVYARMLEVCLAAPNCTSFTMWGFTDRYSWIPHHFEGRGSGLIFDEAYQPKPAYRALCGVLRGHAGGRSS